MKRKEPPEQECLRPAARLCAMGTLRCGLCLNAVQRDTTVLLTADDFSCLPLG